MQIIYERLVHVISNFFYMSAKNCKMSDTCQVMLRNGSRACICIVGVIYLNAQM